MTQLDEIIERMARAINGEIYLNGGDVSDDGWSDCPAGLKDEMRRCARAALAAALEGLGEMVEAAHRRAQYSPAPYTDGKHAIRARFAEMKEMLAK